jgi:hypothetical protein
MWGDPNATASTGSCYYKITNLDTNTVLYDTSFTANGAFTSSTTSNIALYSVFTGGTISTNRILADIYNFKLWEHNGTSYVLQRDMTPTKDYTGKSGFWGAMNKVYYFTPAGTLTAY